MALDEALMVLAGKIPTVRIYSWQPACISIGYAQSKTRYVKAEVCARLGIDIVRRPTGGGAVLHDAEITYSLIARETHSAVCGGIMDSYRKVSGALLAAMAVLGLGCDLAPPTTPASASPICFDAQSGHEVSFRGRKLVGSAQLRRGGMLLQHGSILLDLDPDRTLQVLRTDPTTIRMNGGTGLLGRATSLREALGHAVSFGEASHGLIAGFEEYYGIELVAGNPTAQESRLAADLRRSKYINPEWTTIR